MKRKVVVIALFMLWRQAHAGIPVVDQFFTTSVLPPDVVKLKTDPEALRRVEADAYNLQRSNDLQRAKAYGVASRAVQGGPSALSTNKAMPPRQAASAFVRSGAR